jgi:hypothetical protein
MYLSLPLFILVIPHCAKFIQENHSDHWVDEYTYALLEELCQADTKHHLTLDCLFLLPTAFPHSFILMVFISFINQFGILWALGFNKPILEDPVVTQVSHWILCNSSRVSASSVYCALYHKESI